MGLMWARRRIEEAQRRAALKARAQKERHTAAHKKHGKPSQPVPEPTAAIAEAKDVSRNKGTK